MPPRKGSLLLPIRRLVNQAIPRSSESQLAGRAAPDITRSPTVDELKKAEKHSRAYERFTSICRGSVLLAKLVEPCLEGTPFKAVVSVFVAIAEAVESVKDTRASADALLNGLSERLSIVEDHFAKANDNSSRAILTDFARALVRDAGDIHRIRHAQITQALNSEGLRSKLEDVVWHIDKTTENFRIRVLLEIERDTKSVHDRLFRHGLRHWNRAPSARYHADVQHGYERQACTAGTRVDVLDRIIRWATDASSPPIFWLSGMAGSGKSTIAYTVCQHFSEQESLGASLGASFFCSRQVGELRRLQNIIPTIVYQLARHSRSFAEALDCVDTDIVEISREQVGKLLFEPWSSSMHERADELPLTLIVIDALDEIEHEGGATLLDGLIDAAHRLGPKCARQLKILVTSRPHPRIVASTAQFPPDVIYRLEDIGKDSGRDDILKFLADKLPDLAASRVDLLETLADRSEELFIYAATVVRLLFPLDSSLRLSTRERQQKLSRVLQDTEMSHSPDLKAVYSLYTQVLSEAIPEVQRSLRLPTLRRIICTLQPLPINALARLSDVSSDDEDVDVEATALLVQALHSVLYISDSDQCVYVYHKSFSDFMLDDGLSGSLIACDVDMENAALSRSCFRIMQSSLRFNICHLPSSYLLDSEVPNLAQSVKTNITDVVGLEYACRHWALHLTKVPCVGENTQNLCMQLLEFIGEKVLFWIEVMNLLGAKVSCHDGLKSATEWVMAARTSLLPETVEELGRMLLTTSRFSNSFLQTAASLSTPHLYISCLPAEFGINPEALGAWKARFGRVPHIQCTGFGSQDCALTHIGVNKVMNSVVFTPDGTRIVSGSSGKAVHVWDASTGEELLRMTGHADAIYSVAVSPDGCYIAAGAANCIVCVWNVQSGEEMQVLSGHSREVRSVAFSPDGALLVSGSRDRTVRIWNVFSGAEVHKYEGHTEAVSSAEFSSDGTRVVSGSFDTSVRIWDAITGAQLHKLVGHRGGVRSVAFAHNGMHIVSCSDDRTVRIWDALTGVELHQLLGHTSLVYSVAFSSNSMQIASVSADRSVRIWDVLRGEEVQKLHGHSDWITSVAFSPNGSRIATCSPDMSIRIWDASIGASSQRKNGHKSGVNSVAFSSDGSHIVSGSDDHSLRIWNASTGEEVRQLLGHTGVVWSVAFSSDNTCVISGSVDKSVRIWSTDTGEEVQKFEGHWSPVRAVAFAPDGVLVASGSYDKSVRLWNTQSKTQVHRLSGHTSCVRSVAFSPNGTLVVSGSEDKSVRIWDVSSGAQIKRLSGHADRVLSVAFAPDATHIVSCSSNESARIWDMLAGITVQRLRSQTNSARSVAYSPSGMRVVSGFADKSVGIWDAPSGAQVRRFGGHTDKVSCAAFSYDGLLVVSGSKDRSVRIWNTSVEDVAGWAYDEKSGWVVSTPSRKRLLWLPKHFSTCLQDGRRCVRVISRSKSTLLTFQDDFMGSEWAGCYQSL